MAVFLLVQAPDLHQRVSTHESGVKRIRLSFPSTDFLQNLLQTHNIQRARRQSNYKILGLVCAKPGVVLDDVLSVCNRQELRVWQSYFRGNSGFTIEVQERFIFAQPLSVHACLQRAGRAETQSLDTRNFPLAVFFPKGLGWSDIEPLPGCLQPGTSSAVQCQACVALQRWQKMQHAKPLAIPVLDPIVSLIACGAWETIGYYSKWPLECALFPGTAFPVAQDPSDCDDEMCDGPELPNHPNHSTAHAPQREVFSRQRLDTAADQLRVLAQTLLPLVADPKQRAAHFATFKNVVGWMENVNQGLGGSSLQPYSSETLLNGVLFSACLSSTKKVTKAVPLAVKLAAPALDLESFGQQFPEDATLRRAGTYLDLAFTLFARDFWSREACFHWAWADSSPQSSRDWLMLRHVSCSQEDVLYLYRAVNMLIRGRPDYEDHFEAQCLDLNAVPGLHDILSSIKEHACLPVAMGHAKTSLEDKVATFLHSTAMECHNLRGLHSHLNNFVSWTTDLGVEVGIPVFSTTNWESLLPPFMQSALQVDVPSDDNDPRSQDLPDLHSDPKPLMPRALVVPGALHLIHNMTSDLHQRLTYWPEFYEHLKHVVHLFAARHLKERFVATCVRRSAIADAEDLFQSVGISSLYEKRWQAVLKALKALLPVFENLRCAWSLEVFLQGRADNEDNTAAGVDAALKSPMFCSYIYMVHSIHDVLGRFQAWLEACPCHHHLFPCISDFVRRKKRKKLFSKFAHSDCPMRGKRSAELASGQVDAVLSELFNIRLSVEEDSLRNSLSEEDSRKLDEEFNRAKAYLHFGLVQKFEFWQKLPWLLTGLSHHFTSIAREVARSCIAQFDASMSKPKMELKDHHALSQEFLMPGGPLRAAMEDFARGMNMSVDLETAVAPLKFVPVVERVIEGMHRDVKIASKHVQLGPTRVSLAVRLPEIMRLIEADACVRDELIRLMDLTRHARKCAGALNLSSHPIFIELVQKKDFTASTWLRAVAMIVHRCELDEQFASFDSQKKTMRNRCAKMLRVLSRFMLLCSEKSLAHIQQSCSAVLLNISAQMLSQTLCIPCHSRTCIRCSHLLATRVLAVMTPNVWMMLRVAASFQPGWGLQGCSSGFYTPAPAA